MSVNNSTQNKCSEPRRDKTHLHVYEVSSATETSNKLEISLVAS